MHVCVIGTGYVGLVTGACLAHTGHSAVCVDNCVDNNAAKIAQLQAGRSPIDEPGLESIMQSAMVGGTLTFTTDLAAGVAHGDILFIAVGTPSLPTGESDTRYVEAVARGIGSHLDARYRVFVNKVNKSTVPIGSGNWVRGLILETLSERDSAPSPNFAVVSNPEFLREGSAVSDTFNPQVAQGIGLDSRISPKFLQAGIG